MTRAGWRAFARVMLVGLSPRESRRTSLRSGLRLSILAALLIAAPSQPSAEGSGDLRKLEEGVFAAVNDHRRSAGLRELSYSPEIARVARSHSDAMAGGRVGFGHSGFDKRAKSLSSSMSLSAAAENIFKHPEGRSQVPRAALATWLKSSRHRKNIEGGYDLTGVGAARDSGGSYYLTQIFVAR